MADRYLLESSGVDGYLLEDGSGVFLTEAVAGRQAIVSWASISIPKVAATLTADVATFAWTGNDVVFGIAMPATAATFVWTGNDATLAYARALRLTADAATFAETGNDATLTYTPLAKTLSAATGAFTWTGNDAASKRTYVFPVTTASYTWTGNDAALDEGHILAAGAATFAWAGNDAALTRTVAKTVAADAATFAWAGNDATLTYAASTRGQAIVSWVTLSIPRIAIARTMAADAATFAWTGNDVTGLVPGQSADVYWLDIGGEDAYRVKWGPTSGGPYTHSVDLIPQTTSYTITGLGARTTWFWTVTGLVADVEQTPSAEGVFTVGIPPAVADPQTFDWTGGTATLLTVGIRMPADVGTFAWTGFDTGFEQLAAFEVLAGTFDWVGSDAFFPWIHVMAAEQASYSLDGADAILTKNQRFTVDTVSFDWVGNDTGYLRDYALEAEFAEFDWEAESLAFPRRSGDIHRLFTVYPRPGQAEVEVVTPRRRRR